jgi:beta-lactam-binding protein with PASTA domain
MIKKNLFYLKKNQKKITMSDLKMYKLTAVSETLNPAVFNFDENSYFTSD